MLSNTWYQHFWTQVSICFSCLPRFLSLLWDYSLVYVGWYADYYGDELRNSIDEAKEKSLQAGYPNIIPDRIIEVNTATTLVDNSGKIIAWVLPSCMGSEFQVSRLFYHFDSFYLLWSFFRELYISIQSFLTKVLKRPWRDQNQHLGELIQNCSSNQPVRTTELFQEFSTFPRGGMRMAMSIKWVICFQGFIESTILNTHIPIILVEIWRVSIEHFSDIKAGQKLQGRKMDGGNERCLSTHYRNS